MVVGFAIPHLQWLARTQRADGLLIDASDAPANFTSNGLAAYVLAHFERVRPKADTADLRRLIGGIINTKGISVNDPIRARTTHYRAGHGCRHVQLVEPTAWCVLALKKAAKIARGDRAHRRRRQTDRESGLRIRRLELRQRKRARPGPAAVRADDRHRADRDAGSAPHGCRRASVSGCALALKEPSAMALALATIALRIHGLPVEDVDMRLPTMWIGRAIGKRASAGHELYALSS